MWPTIVSNLVSAALPLKVKQHNTNVLKINTFKYPNFYLFHNNIATTNRKIKFTIQHCNDTTQRLFNIRAEFL